jgi:hypothetical protein
VVTTFPVTVPLSVNPGSMTEIEQVTDPGAEPFVTLFGGPPLNDKLVEVGMNTPVPPDENVRFAAFQVCAFARPLLMTKFPLSPLVQPEKVPVTEFGAFTGPAAKAGTAPAIAKAPAAARPATA